jgi:hypothetical protein
MKGYKLRECSTFETVKNRHDLDDIPLYKQMFLGSEEHLAQLQRFAVWCSESCSEYDDCTRQDEEIDMMKKELQMI